MECVEVVRNADTSDATVETTVELARRIGKVPVILNKEISGFVANRILGAARDEAISLYENGVASVEDVDTACKTAFGYPTRRAPRDRHGPVGRDPRPFRVAAIVVRADAVAGDEDPVSFLESGVRGSGHRTGDVDAADEREAADDLAGPRRGQRILVVDA